MPEATVFIELRTYTIMPGRLEELRQQFDDVTLPLFERLGISTPKLWTRTLPMGHQLIYALEFDSKEARDAFWPKFRSAPEWLRAQSARQDLNLPPLVAGIDIVELTG